MSGAPLLMLAAAATNEKRQEEQKKEKERLEQLAKQTAQEKIAFLASKAILWQNDEDIVSAYQNVLMGKLSFNSVQDYTIQEISIKDFFAFLTHYKEKESAVRLIQEHKLFEKTYDYNPFAIRSFIKATSFQNSVLGRGKCRYSVEHDIYENRQKLFLFYCPQQRKPICKKNPCMSSYWASQEIFLDILKEYTHPALREALCEDIVIPATIIASNDKKFEKMYRHFLEKKTFFYSSDKKTIDETFEKARKAAQTPEYQNLFIPPCPAIKTKWKYGIIPSTVIDESQSYECPIIKKALETQNSR